MAEKRCKSLKMPLDTERVRKAVCPVDDEKPVSEAIRLLPSSGFANDTRQAD
jgi:hypothetical protein